MMNYEVFIGNTSFVNEKSKISKKELVLLNKKLTLKLNQFKKEKKLKKFNKYVAGSSVWDD